MNSVFDESKNYKMIIHQDGEMRFSRDENHQQEILLNAIRKHVQSIIGVSRKVVDKQGVVFQSIFESKNRPAKGKYRFELSSDTQIDITIDDGSPTSQAITKGVLYKNFANLNFDVIIHPNSQIGDYVEFYVVDGARYGGGNVSFDNSTVTLEAGFFNISGYDVSVNQQNTALTLLEGQKRYLVLKTSLQEIDYTADPAVLGHYITAQDMYHTPSPKALKLLPTIVLYDSLQSIPADTSTDIYTLIAEVGVQSGLPYSTMLIQHVSEMIKNDNVIYNYLTETELNRIKTLVNNLTINLDDGNGDRVVETKKVPSAPNKVDASTVVITAKLPSNPKIKEIEDKLKLREIERTNISALNTQILKLQELKSLAVTASDKSELTAKIDECQSINALDQTQADYLKNTATLAEIPDLIGDTTTGYVGAKYSAKTASEDNVETYEKDVYSLHQQARIKEIDDEIFDDEGVKGIVELTWTEPSLVDNEEIVGYKVKVFKVGSSFSDTKDDLISAGANTPSTFATQKSQYVLKSVPVMETDRKVKKIITGSVQYEEVTPTNKFQISANSDSKFVVFIATISEFDVVSDWSDPIVINVGDLVVDTQTGKTFKEEIEDRLRVLRVKREVEISRMNKTVEDKLFELQLSYADKVDKTELIQKINEIQGV